MANQYNFTSAAGTIGDALHDMLAERELTRQKQAEEARQAAMLKIQQDENARAATTAAENTKVAEQNRVKSAIDAVGRGGSIDPSLATDAGKTGLGGMIDHAAPAITETVTPETDPAKKQGIYAGIIASSAPSVGNADAAPGMVSRGTPAERAQAEKDAILAKASKALVGVTDRQEAMRRVLDAGIPAADADTLITAYMGPKQANPKTILYRTKTGALALDAEGKRPYTNPQLPQDYQIVNDPTTGANGATPFFVGVQTSTGTVPMNGRTGQHYDPSANGGQGGWVDGVMSLRPTGAQQQDMANNAAALASIDLIKQDFNPAWVGPAAGRIGTMYTAYADDAAGLSRLQTRVASLKNRFIKAITGAQMSEQEATRIMKEMPDMNLPPTTFMERLSVAEENLNNVMEIQQQVYTGQRRPTGVPVTEAQLQKLFPDTNVKTGEKKTGEGAAPPAATTSTTSGDWLDLGNGVKVRKAK